MELAENFGYRKHYNIKTTWHIFYDEGPSWSYNYGDESLCGISLFGSRGMWMRPRFPTIAMDGENVCQTCRKLYNRKVAAMVMERMTGKYDS